MFWFSHAPILVHFFRLNQTTDLNTDFVSSLVADNLAHDLDAQEACYSALLSLPTESGPLNRCLLMMLPCALAGNAASLSWLHLEIAPSSSPPHFVHLTHGMCPIPGPLCSAELEENGMVPTQGASQVRGILDLPVVFYDAPTFGPDSTRHVGWELRLGEGGEGIFWLCIGGPFSRRSTPCLQSMCWRRCFDDDALTHSLLVMCTLLLPHFPSPCGFNHHLGLVYPATHTRTRTPSCVIP